MANVAGGYAARGLCRVTLRRWENQVKIFNSFTNFSSFKDGFFISRFHTHYPQDKKIPEFSFCSYILLVIHKDLPIFLYKLIFVLESWGPSHEFWERNKVSRGKLRKNRKISFGSGGSDAAKSVSL